MTISHYLREEFSIFYNSLILSGQNGSEFPWVSFFRVALVTGKVGEKL